jgi:hypothetical protein
MKFSFSSEDLSSSFGQMTVEGEAEIGKEIDMTIQGEVKDVKQARHFTSAVLLKNFNFPEIRGMGMSNIHIFGEYYSPQIRADFAFSPGGYGRFDVNSVEGEAELIRNEFFGRFNIDDPFLKGKISLFSSPEGVKVDVQLDRGFVERIFPAFDIEIPLQGEGSGIFEVRQKNEDIELQGTFSSPSLQFLNKNLKDVNGKLEWDGSALSLSEVQFNLHGGVIKGDAKVDLLAEDFDIDIIGDEIDLSTFYARQGDRPGWATRKEGLAWS